MNMCIYVYVYVYIHVCKCTGDYSTVHSPGGRTSMTCGLKYYVDT